MNEPKVDVLLATYNGEVHLERQLNSISAQTHKNWRLIARDDGSTDNTRSILGLFASRFPNQVTIVEDSKSNVGLTENFGILLNASTSEYVAFCDQDDYWYEDKLEYSIQKIVEVEGGKKDRPALIATDRRVVDENGNQISASFWVQQGNGPENKQSVFDFALQPCAPGNTMLFNKALCELSRPFPKNARFHHDTWVELVAWIFGNVRYFDVSTLDYLKHSLSVTSLRPSNRVSKVGRVFHFVANWEILHSYYLRYFEQAGQLLQVYGDDIPAPIKKELERLVALPERPMAQRLALAFSIKALPRDIAKKLAIAAVCGR